MQAPDVELFVVKPRIKREKVAMETRVKWIDHMSFVAESGSGHSVVMDGPPASGGRDLGVRPMEMVLMGLGGCSSYDMVSMLKKARQPLGSLEVKIEATRVDDVPAVFETIHVRFIVKGEGMSEKQVKRAADLSIEKYCSVSKMLEKTATITHSLELNGEEIAAG